MKKLAIVLSIFPGILFVIALLSYVICFFAERNLPSGGVNIGLSLLLLAALINIPTIVVWVILLARKRDEGTKTAPGDDARSGKRRMFVAAYLVAGLVIGVLSGMAITVSARAQDAPDVNRVSSIEEWEERTQLPGFTLLDRADLPGYYVCVYDTGLGEIAFCYNQKKPEDADSHSFGVYDTQGQNLQDGARWNDRFDLNSHDEPYFITGMVVPIKPDYREMIQIEFKENSESVYTKRLPHNSNSTQDAADQPTTRSEPKPEGRGELELESKVRPR